MPQITLSFTTSAFVVALLVLISVAISVYFYRHTVPPIPRGKKIFLILLRSIALSLLFIFLCEPLFRLISTSTQQPVLAVLVDNSKSMNISDKTGERSVQLRNALKNDALKKVSGELRFYAFGTGVRSLENGAVDSLNLDEDATDISATLRAVAEEKERYNIGAALLLTDGSYNLGLNPIYEAEQIGIPLYAVGIGDSTEQKDLLVTKVVTNELVYNHSDVPVDVTIKSSGFKGEKVEVILAEGNKELGRQQLVLQEGTREYSARLSYIPEGEGMKKYSVRVSRLPGELTTTNNQKTFLARVLKSKLRVLILGGSPSPDVSLIKQTLAEDNNLEVHSLTQKNPTVFYEGQLTQQSIDSADCILLIAFPSSSTSGATVDLVKNSITRKTIPVLFVNGKSIDERKLSALSSLLPFTAGSVSPNEQLVFIEPVQKHHPVLATNTDEGIESWKRLPPIFKMQTSYKAKSEATVLASTRINNIVLNEPLIAIRNVNKQKSLAVLGYGVWRWRLMAQGNPRTEKLFSTFLSNSIRWLTTRDDNRPVKVTPSKPAFTQGEPAEFAGQVYDASANPVENAQVKIVAQREGREFQTTLRPIGNGHYEGTFEGLGEGDYTYLATANADGQPLGEDKGRFSVGELALEFQDTRMNVQLLRQLAARTGGDFFLPSQLSGLPGMLNGQPGFASRELKTAREFELWNWKYMLALVVLLLSVEWFVRKRSGML